ncbi:MAG: hypothetical protein V1835_07115 [Candidatus Micrarchaeota archaeon]
MVDVPPRKNRLEPEKWFKRSPPGTRRLKLIGGIGVPIPGVVPATIGREDLKKKAEEIKGEEIRTWNEVYWVLNFTPQAVGRHVREYVENLISQSTELGRGTKEFRIAVEKKVGEIRKEYAGFLQRKSGDHPLAAYISKHGLLHIINRNHASIRNAEIHVPYGHGAAIANLLEEHGLTVGKRTKIAEHGGVHKIIIPKTTGRNLVFLQALQAKMIR